MRGAKADRSAAADADGSSFRRRTPLRSPRLRRRSTRHHPDRVRSRWCGHTLWRRPTMGKRVTVAWVLAAAMFAAAASASAQSGSSGTSTAQSTASQQPSSSTASTTEETRPATTTFFGDTGLWFVPTGEVLAGGKWSVSGYRRGTNWIQGYTNVGDFAGTFGVGIKDRAEIFGSVLFDTPIDRDLYPLFV